jgi:arylsulfatase A-like enzyme
MAARLTLFACGILITCAEIAAAAEKPNVIVIVGDDMGYADVGAHGCQDIPTPHLDALASAGVRCTNGYVTGPYCSPTRAGLLTGRYQTRFGHEFNPGGAQATGQPTGLPLTETLLPERMKAAGYATGMVGKWHLGNDEGYRPPERGFDEFFGFLPGAHTYFAKGRKSILRGDEPVDEQEYLTDAFGREAVAFVDRHQNEPFFLYLAFNAVHTPMEADDARLKKFAGIENEQRRIYAGMMSAMDDAVGAVLDKLRETGLEENTLVFFISDNGGPTMRGVTVNASDNAPLRGSKRTTLEGGVRVPFFVKWPAKLPAGKVFDQPVIQLDFLPTILAAAGAEPYAEAEGVDLLPYFHGETAKAPHDALYWRFGDQMAIRRGDWKLVRYDATVDGAEKPVVTPAKLYNLADDIGEALDLAAAEPEKANELQAAWDQWNESNVPPAWGQGGSKKKAAGKQAAAGKKAKAKKKARRATAGRAT